MTNIASIIWGSLMDCCSELSDPRISWARRQDWYGGWNQLVWLGLPAVSLRLGFQFSRTYRDHLGPVGNGCAMGHSGFQIFQG